MAFKDRYNFKTDNAGSFLITSPDDTEDYLEVIFDDEYGTVDINQYVERLPQADFKNIITKVYNLHKKQAIEDVATDL